MSAPPNSVLRQLPLSIVLDEAMTRDNWLSRPDTLALERWLFAAAEGALLRADAGLGKSHLLQALCHDTPGSLYLPLVELMSLPPMALLEGAEDATLVALDDLQQLAGHADWQEALFHLFNRALPRGTRIVAASRVKPAALAGLLPDLRSRLEALPAFHLPRFNEAELDALLELRAERRGFALPTEVRAYLLRRGPRAPAALLALLAEVDREALARQRAVTIPLLQELKLFPPDR